MMKPKYFTHLLIIAVFFLAGCKSCRRKGLESSLIDVHTAVEFRTNFLYRLDDEYHIPQSLMFETAEFEALFSMKDIDKIRLYPAINTHDDPYEDSLTFIMVPVNGNTNSDDLTGYIFDFAEACPYNCPTSSAVPVQAPTEHVLGLNIPKNWCVPKQVINDVIADAEAEVGEGNVYGIRFCWYKNDLGVMDLELKPTTPDGDGMIINIEGLSYKNVTEICYNTANSCCDTNSPLHHGKPRKK